MPKEEGMERVLYFKPFRPRSVRDESAEKTLIRVEKRLKQVQFELNNWITVPTRYGIEVTHNLEAEKVLMLKVKNLLVEEIEKPQVLI